MSITDEAPGPAATPRDAGQEQPVATEEPVEAPSPDASTQEPAEAQPPATEEAAEAGALASFDVPPGLSSGRFFFSQNEVGIIGLDLATGEVRVLYEPPPEGLIVSARAHPDGSLIMMAYAPPPPEGEIQLGYTDLYLLPTDGSGPPEVFMASAVENEILFNPTWSPDGTMLYYGHVNAPENPDGASSVTLERVAFPGGQPEVVLENVFWPAISPDGTRIAYVRFDPQSGREQLVVSNADTSEPKTLMPLHSFDALDALLFSPDGEEILFSAATFDDEGRNNMPSWLMGLFGVQVARAHTSPSDLWTVPVSGGQPERLTSLLGINMQPAYSPDGEYIAITTVRNTYVMRADGSDLQLLSSQPGLSMVGWVR